MDFLVCPNFIPSFLICNITVIRAGVAREILLFSPLREQRFLPFFSDTHWDSPPFVYSPMPDPTVAVKEEIATNPAQVKEEPVELILDHVPDELEAALEAMMDESKPPVFDWPLLIPVALFNAVFPRLFIRPDVANTLPRQMPSPAVDVVTHTPKLLFQEKKKDAIDNRVPYGVPQIDSYYPVEDHERNIAVTEIRTDNEDVETWIISSNPTIDELRKLCTARWNIALCLVFENTMQFDSTRLFYFDPRFLRHAPLFCVDIQVLPSRCNMHVPQPMGDRLVCIRVFNVDTSQIIKMLIPPFATVFRLANWVAQEWQWAFDFAFKNLPFGHGARIGKLLNMESPHGTPVLAFASHQLCPGA